MEEWKKQLLSTAENIGKITVSACEGLKKFVSSETFKQLIDFLSNIPDDIQETELFQSILELRKSKITYDTIDWFQNEIHYSTYESSLSTLKKLSVKTDLDEYAISIIESENLNHREKLVVLLVHFEALVYQAMTHERKPNDRIKSIALNCSKDLHEMDIESYKRLLIYGIVFIVFSDTDNVNIYKDEIDRRIPFRNNILHRGTMSYTDDEAKIAYETLVYFIAELAIIAKK